MKTVNLSSEEIRALYEYLQTNPCSSGCAYSEMISSKKDCTDCALTKSRDSILEKLEK